MPVRCRTAVSPLAAAVVVPTCLWPRLQILRGGFDGSRQHGGHVVVEEVVEGVRKEQSLAGREGAEGNEGRDGLDRSARRGKRREAKREKVRG